MDQWEALLEDCPGPPDLRYFSKAIQLAGIVFKEDLAPFETEWILQTLLYKPINLISTVTLKRSDENWMKVIGDAFKLLTGLCSAPVEGIDKYFEDIIKIARLPLDSQSRKQALMCLRSVARRFALAAREVAGYVASLEETSTCRAPLALLIGTICEYHPETVADDVNKIWRIFLNLLDGNKNTSTITQSLLYGVLGILKHFGCDLPTAELNTFYDKLSSEYIKTPRCQEVCLKILKEHANLFPEKLSSDVELRRYLWTAALQNSSHANVVLDAAVSVYAALGGAATRQELQNICITELLPQTISNLSQIKYTSLRILSYMKQEFRMDIEIDSIDVQSLEFELRSGTLTYDVANAISYCLESKLANTDTLLQSCIVFYENIPSAKRRDILVHGILNADPDLRTAATNFLITESTKDLASLDKYLQLWTNTFDTKKNTDYTVMEKSKYVFEELMSFVVFVLETVLEEEVEISNEKLSTLLRLTSHVLSIQPAEEYTRDFATVLIQLLVRTYSVYADAAVMAAVRYASAHIEDDCDGIGDFYRTLGIDRCKDEALLCETCLALIHAPEGSVEVASVLLALQIIFSRNDCEPSTLGKALKRFENILLNDKNTDEDYDDIINQIEKLKSRIHPKKKEDRILHRDIVMFLGKFGKRRDENNNTTDTLAITKLMESLNLNIPNPEDGSHYKVNLRSLVQIALEQEDSNALHTLLVIICANLSTANPTLSSKLQLVLCRVCRALCRCHSRGVDIDTRALHYAVTTCDSVDSVHEILEYISTEKSPGVRKMLSDALEELLVRKDEPDLVTAVAQQASLLMVSGESTTKRAGLNITEILITVFKNNNQLTFNLMPDILVKVSETFEVDSNLTFAAASKHFIEKIELFTQSSVDDLVVKLIGVLIEKNIGNTPQNYPSSDEATSSRHADNRADRDTERIMTVPEVKIYKNTVKMIMVFIKDVMEYRNETKDSVFDKFLTVFEKDGTDIVKSLYVLAEMRNLFDFDVQLCRTVLSYKECCITSKFLSMDVAKDNLFCIEAALKFSEEYSEVLLELKCQANLEFLGGVIKNLMPECVKHLHKEIRSCIAKYTNNTTPGIIQTALEEWCQNLPLTAINIDLEKECFPKEDAVVLFALKTMLKTVKTTDLSAFTDVKNKVKNWGKILLNLFSRDYIQNYLRSKMAYLTDVLTVAVKFLTVTDVKKLLLEGSTLEGLPTEKIGVKYCCFFMSVFYEILVSKPQFLLDEDMKPCSVLIYNIVRYALKKKRSDEEYALILELVDKLWPAYSQVSTNSQKQSLLVDMANFPKKLGAESNPLRWAVSVIVNGSREDAARLLIALPGGPEFSDVYRTFASVLPSRLSELQEAARASLRALLDALAASRDPVLLDIVVTLAEGDNTKGWWDDAIQSCMATIAVDADLALCKDVFTRSNEGISLQICTRVLLPLLRYSTSSFCESFFASVLPELLTLKVTRPSTHYNYHKNIVDHTRVFVLLTLAVEKISLSSLESPSSHLYSRIDSPKSWHLLRQTCKICISLRDTVVPEGASEQLATDIRLLNCMNYNCLSAAICRWRQNEQIYKTLFDTKVWDDLLDHNREYRLKITSQWNQRTKRQAVSIELDKDRTLSLSHSTARTTRSRMLLRTLTECPLAFDLIEDTSVEEVQTQDLELPENELNDHPVAGTLSALFRYVASLKYTSWQLAVVTALREARRNTRWLIARAICNSKEELKSIASVFRPALLALISSTAIENNNNKKLLNGLHVDIIGVLHQWGDNSPTASEDLNKTTGLLINTCLEYRKYDSLYKTLVDVLTKFLSVYGSVVTVDFKVFEGYFDDSETPKTLEILQCLSKSKIYMAELLPTLLNRLEAKHTYQLVNLTKLFGLAVTNCTEKQRYLFRFREVLDNVRKSNPGDYIKMLFYSQSGCQECCDEYHFRKIVPLTVNTLSQDRTKCLNILTTFISSSQQQDYIREMYETLDLTLIVTTETVEVLRLVKVGVKHMSESVRRRLVLLAAGFCGNSQVKVRREALEVILQGLDDLIATNTQPSSAKKIKTTNSQILTYINSTDIYVKTIIQGVSSGVLDRDGSIAELMRQGLARYLSKDMSSRYNESLLLCVYLPVISNNRSLDLSACLPALLEVLFYELKNNDRFKKLKLKEEPLEFRESNAGPVKLLTISRTYQGTFRAHASMSGRLIQIQEANLEKPPVDVQVSLESILDALLQFSKQSTLTAQELCVNLAKALPGLESETCITEALVSILTNDPNDLTPFVIEMCRLFIKNFSKIGTVMTTAKALKDKTWNTEGEALTKSLYNDFRIRLQDDDHFVLGRESEMEYKNDVDMVENKDFSLEDLSSAFGKLSNWDIITMQNQKVLKSQLPALWTENYEFKKQLDNFNPRCGWFSKMVSAYKGEDAENAIKWLRNIDKWPRRSFEISATTEAIEWLLKKEDDVIKPVCDVQARDCLVEWSARLLLRKAYHLLSDEPQQSELMRSRSHELKWCLRASEMGLDAPILECVKRNTPDLYKSEILPWLYHKTVVLRNQQLSMYNRDRNYRDEFKEAIRNLLQTAETYTPEFADVSKDVDVLAMNQLIVMLNMDLYCDNLDIIPKTVDLVWEHLSERRHDVKNKKSLHTLFKIMLKYVEKIISFLPDSLVDGKDLWTVQVDILSRIEDLNITDYGMACYVISQLCNLPPMTEATARKFLDQVQRNYYNDFVRKQLYLREIPVHLRSQYFGSKTLHNNSWMKYKKCFQLVCDPEYTLLQYCKKLLKELQEGGSSSETSQTVIEKIFENKYSGSDYQLLNKYKQLIEQFENTNWLSLSDEEKQGNVSKLKEITVGLSRKQPQSVFRLSQLCPTLTDCQDCPSQLLGLPNNVTVVKFHEQVTVYTDSIRRPAVLRALLSNGKTKRYLHKYGEPMENDAGAQLVVKYAAQLWSEIRCPVVGYSVTPLSDDCGLIEYLDNYERIRDMVAETCDLDALLKTVNRPHDNELFRAPMSANLSQYRQMCKLVPSHALRDAILKRSVTQSDFLSKSKRFQDTVCSSTILTWLLGLRDRHLQNILCSTQDGGVCHVDWGDLDTFKLNEMAPARLTRNILAVCDVDELEARLQQLLSVLSESSQLFLAAASVSLCLHDGIESKLKCTSGYSKVYEAVGESDRTRYTELISYENWRDDTVDQQITWLLNKCTDPRILSHTRSGWEPWV